MEKYSEVVGLPVICVDNGKKLGVVEDIVFCPGTKELKAFILERKGCQLDRKIILKKDVLSLGKDALIVNDCSCARNLRSAQDAEELKDKGEINGLRVYSKAGRDLGFVKDVLFDGSTGIIEGVEISDGLVQDIVDGRKILPLFGKVEFSQENILVDREAVEEMTNTGGGLKNILQR